LHNDVISSKILSGVIIRVFRSWLFIEVIVVNTIPLGIKSGIDVRDKKTNLLILRFLSPTNNDKLGSNNTYYIPALYFHANSLLCFWLLFFRVSISCFYHSSILLSRIFLAPRFTYTITLHIINCFFFFKHLVY